MCAAYFWLVKVRLLSKRRWEVYFNAFVYFLSFMVITLLGRELSELRRRAHDRKLSRATGLKVGIQVVQVFSLKFLKKIFQ